MPDILVRSVELYVEKLRVCLDQSFDTSTATRLFPVLDKSDLTSIERLIRSLMDLIPPLGAVIINKDNLPEDRSRMALVFTYLIMPFDILSNEQHGLIGYLDDALIAHLLAAKMSEPEDSVAALVAESRSDVTDLMTKLPDWFTRSVARFSTRAVQQFSPMQN